MLSSVPSPTLLWGVMSSASRCSTDLCLPVVAAGADGRDAVVAAQNADLLAAVAAQDDDLEAAVALSPMAFAEIQVEQPFNMNNHALKWIRDSHEFPPTVLTVTYVDLTDQDPLQIGVLERPHGMQYRFTTGLSQPWS